MRLFPLLTAAAALVLSACDRHEWESKNGEDGVKELYTHHGDDHGHGDEHHGDDHHGDEGHGDKHHGDAADHHEEDSH